MEQLTLKDGTEILVRPIRPDDKAELAAGLGRLSEASRRARFLTAKPRFSSSELRYLTEVDNDSHVALVAFDAAAPDRLIAVGRFVRLSDPEVAEFAITVADPYQGRGLGKTLAVRLADEARRVGVRRFTATVLSDNVAIHRLVEAIAARLHHERRGTVEELVAELAAA